MGVLFELWLSYDVTHQTYYLCFILWLLCNEIRPMNILLMQWFLHDTIDIVFLDAKPHIDNCGENFRSHAVLSMSLLLSEIIIIVIIKHYHHCQLLLS